MNFAQYIDHTILNPVTLLAEVETVCNEARENGFAAVCVPPPFVKKAKGFTSGSSVKVATVIGFPFGYSAVEAKLAEVMLAIVDGADELDIVINLAALKNNDWQYLANEINHLLSPIRQKNKVVNIIIETGILTEDEIIKCCELYSAAGVDSIKTSTGYAERGATLEAVKLMRTHLAPSVKIKASDGIHTVDFAKQLIEAGANRLGCSSSVEIVQEAKKLICMEE
ncbi:MAG: deoxyribose-phosphate aldolase [Ferruginibacter sp.]|nr:deoxyribose-phosphate aldolase [Ferruginibacter sp.]